MEREISDVRSELGSAYSDATGATKDYWKEVDQNIEKFQVSVKQESADSIDNLEAILNSLASDIKPDDKALCKAEGGEWKEFSDACADKCGTADICAQVLTYSCDCGPNQCWNGTSCV
jgi:hypothetical protein